MQLKKLIGWSMLVLTFSYLCTGCWNSKQGTFREVMIVDSAGRPCIRLTTEGNGSPVIELRGSAGHCVVHEDQIEFLRSSGRNVSLSLSDPSVFSFRDPTKREEFSVRFGDESSLVTVQSHGRSIKLTTAADFASIALGDYVKEKIQLSWLTPQEPQLIFLDDRSKTSVSLMPTTGVQGGLVFYGTDGQVIARFPASK